MMEQKDYYNILGVSKTDSKDDIKKAYKKLVMKYHPDKSSDSEKSKNEERFKEISEAYAVIGDEEKRKQYDTLGHSNYSSGGGFGQQNYDFSGSDFESILRDLFGGRFSGRGSDFFHEDPDVSFGDDIRVRLEIELEDSAFGHEKTIQINKKVICESCDGSGAKGGNFKKCDKCNGHGRVLMEQRTPFGTIRQERVCNQCEGIGEIAKEECDKCNGRGVHDVTKTVKVSLPSGIDTGHVLRVKGEGNSIKNGQSGDLLVVIQIKPHKIFSREGDSILFDKLISFSQAALGTKILVPTLYGDQKIKVASGTDSGKVLRLRGKGMPHVNSYGSGDMFITLKIETPKRLNSKQKKLFKELEKLEED
jgi:molecular chaperone DnaJ